MSAETGRSPLRTKHDFEALVAEVEAQPGYQRPWSFGLGVATTVDDTVLDVRFLTVNLEESFGIAALLTRHLGTLATGHRFLDAEVLGALVGDLAMFRGERGHANSEALAALASLPAIATFPDHERRPVVAVVAAPQDPPATAADAYLRLHLLSLCRTAPHTLNLDGLFGKLNANVWTTEGVVDQARFAELQAARVANAQPPLVVVLQDKFPRLLDYVSPPGVRVVNPNTVRLGAHLAPGTVVMTAGAVNFNAGTLGPAMIEGRVSAGVVVGARSDVGGGASLMGTLSGGNDIRVELGEDCLVEAMAGLGIPVGDRVRVEVGFYVKGTTPVRVVDSPDWRDNPVAAPHLGTVVKARELIGISDAVFRRNAHDGTPEVVPRGDRVWGELNPALHDA